MFEWLSSTAFAQWMTVSKWAYPAFLAAHGLGLAVVVGLTSMIAIRVLGFPKQLPLAAYNRTIPLGIFAFVVNALSGTGLFIANATTLAENPSFLVKIGSIIVGLIVLYIFYRNALKTAGERARAGLSEYVPTTSDKVLAVVAILIWLVAVIVSGRLIAYLAPDL